jgi:hypothetical protein
MKATKWKGIPTNRGAGNPSGSSAVSSALPRMTRSSTFLRPSCLEESPTHGLFQPSSESLGDALNIDEVAAIFGCSAWTIRQKYVKQGLPCLRTSATGKFLFFRRQVLDWILKQQRKEEWK